MPRSGLRWGALVMAAGLVVGCAEAPVTGRSQLMLIDDEQAAALGADAWQQIKADMKVSGDSAARARVRDMGERIAAVSGAEGIDWEFELFEEPTPNAFALPGGQIGVNTGMLTIAENDDQLAAVLAHEVGHVVARHVSEQLSQSAAIQTALGTAGLTEGAAGALAQMATGVGQLSFSRSAEAEADRIGLEYMARAGYDPRAAVELWRNMETAAGGGQPPEFLSTHPNPGSRIEAIEAALPEVMPVYEENR
ncbi:MAG: M48 family metallopeptidase [Bacteroidota bacterium]|nr:M48 family metallopeptidase [Kiloniellaceae bacterium]